MGMRETQSSASLAERLLPCQGNSRFFFLLVHLPRNVTPDLVQELEYVRLDLDEEQ
jgi:hypothetical protein